MFTGVLAQPDAGIRALSQVDDVFGTGWSV